LFEQLGAALVISLAYLYQVAPAGLTPASAVAGTFNQIRCPLSCGRDQRERWILAHVVRTPLLPRSN
jgi:hypothetical protein